MHPKTRLALYALAATALTPVMPAWAQDTGDQEDTTRKLGPVTVTAGLSTDQSGRDEEVLIVRNEGENTTTLK